MGCFFARATSIHACMLVYLAPEKFLKAFYHLTEVGGRVEGEAFPATVHVITVESVAIKILKLFLGSYVYKYLLMKSNWVYFSYNG